MGRSRAIRDVLVMVDRAAPSRSTVLITGESGTGKELVANAIWRYSPRSRRPFSVINCVAIPDTLLESELFGYERGAFTGAQHRRIGRIEQAAGGTIFLDEIGDMSLSAQAKVLRALQENRICRVGSDKDIEVNVRVVAATNKNLRHEIELGNFREDLYHRLSVIVVRVPTLKERAEDIPALTDYFIQKICAEYGMEQKKIEPKALDELCGMEWPGNIRELENLVQGLAVTSKDSVIRASDVPISGVAKPAASARRDGLDFELDGKTYKEIMKDLENKVLSAAMERYGSITEVARHFQVDRSTIFRKVKELEKEGKMR